MITLQSETLKAVIHPLGAELQELSHRTTGRNFLWSGDPAYWWKFSPVLFPIVGTLKNGQYSINGSAYELPRHGFAREKEFTANQISECEAIFTLCEDASTLEVYPFRFELSIRYILSENQLTVTYSVINTDEQPIWFCLGAHPAFAVPLADGLGYDDYTLRFNTPETTGRYGLQEGLLLNDTAPLLNDETDLPLSTELFARDAIVLKGLHSNSISLVSAKHPAGWTFDFSGWPHLGIWAAKGAPFVCIEPWQGHADTVDHDGDFTKKEGVVELGVGERWEREWRLEIRG